MLRPAAAEIVRDCFMTVLFMGTGSLQIHNHELHCGQSSLEVAKILTTHAQLESLCDEQIKIFHTTHC